MDSRSPMRRRVIPALLIMLVAVAVTLAFTGQAATGAVTPRSAGAAQPIGVSTAVAAQPSAHHQLAAAATNAVITPSQLAFRNDMRKLWEDHITWTRMVIVSFAAGLPDLGAAEQRLLRNQADIGEAIVPFYGRAAGDRLTELLREHILIAVDVLTAAKNGDAAALADAQARWQANADEIAEFLATANPRNWPLADMQAMMRSHLALTTQEAVARLQGDFQADIAAYDQVHLQILDMADMLSTGIIKQFPKRFR
jgi:hypothetical protein